MNDLRKTIDMIAGSYELMRGKIDDRQWLENFAAAIGAESALCVRWTSGQPDSIVTSVFGYYTELPRGWPVWANHVVELASPTEPMLIDDLAESLQRPELIDANPASDPQLLIGIVDWQPSYMFMAAYRDEHLGAWTDEDREHFRELCRLTRRSMLLHKDYARSYVMASTTQDILNASPLSIVSISLDGTVHFANRAAERDFNGRDGVEVRHGKMRTSDPDANAAIQEFIETVKLLKPEQLNTENPAANRDIAIRRPSGGGFQVRLNAVPITAWTVESLESDRMVIAYFFNPEQQQAPAPNQLKEFFGLTSAQARVAHELYNLNNIVDVAEKLNISVNTARTHLRGIYEKTGAANQSQLIRKLSGTIRTYKKEQRDSQ